MERPLGTRPHTARERTAHTLLTCSCCSPPSHTSIAGTNSGSPILTTLARLPILWLAYSVWLANPTANPLRSPTRSARCTCWLAYNFARRATLWLASTVARLQLDYPFGYTVSLWCGTVPKCNTCVRVISRQYTASSKSCAFCFACGLVGLRARCSPSARPAPRVSNMCMCWCVWGHARCALPRAPAPGAARATCATTDERRRAPRLTLIAS